MKSIVLYLLIAVFSLITVHDYIVVNHDSDTQRELILKAGGEISFKDMCKYSQAHDMLHEMVICHDLFLSKLIFNKIFHLKDHFTYNFYITDKRFKNLYRPPIS